MISRVVVLVQVCQIVNGTSHTSEDDHLELWANAIRSVRSCFPCRTTCAPSSRVEIPWYEQRQT